MVLDGIDVEELKQRNETTKGKQYDSLFYLAKIEEYKKLLEPVEETNLAHDA